MARRRRGRLAEALSNFQEAYETTGGILADKEIGDRAQTTQGEYDYTDELGTTTKVKAAPGGWLSPEQRYDQEMQNASTYRKYGLESRAKNAEHMARQGRASDLQFETGLMQREAMKMEQEKQRKIEALTAEFLPLMKDRAGQVRYLQKRFDDDKGVGGNPQWRGLKAQVQETTEGVHVTAINPETGVAQEGPPRFFTYDQIQGQVTKDLLMGFAAIDPKNALHHLASFNQRAEQIELEKQRVNIAQKHAEDSARHNQETHTLNVQQFLEKKAGGMFTRGSADAAAGYDLSRKKAYDTARASLADRVKSGAITQADATKELDDLNFRYGQKGSDAGPKAVGSNHIYTGGQLYAVNESDPTRLSPVSKDPTTTELGEVIRKNLGPRGPGSGRGGDRNDSSGGGKGLTPPRAKSSMNRTYGMLTPYSTVKEGMENDDPAAWQYFEDRYRKGPGILGMQPPEDMIEMLRRRRMQQGM